MLTDRECRALAPGEKVYKRADEKGLHLEVKPSGFKTWGFKYRFAGKEHRIYFGPYPEVSIREARDMRDEARRQLRHGIDPGDERKRVAARRRSGVEISRTFRAIAERWHGLQLDGWKPKHAADVLHSLETEAFPAIGGKGLDEIKPADIRELLLAIQERGATEAAHRLRARISAIFRFAISLDLAEADPAAALKDALRPIRKRMLPALLKLDDCRAFLRALEAEPAYPTTLLASRLLALTAARPGMIRWAQLAEFEDLDGAAPIWRVPAEKMKLERAEAEQEAFEFIVPLSRQAVETVRVAARLAGRRDYLFYSARHPYRPMSENALNVMYRRIPAYAGRHVPHGWRSSFSTIMNERAIDLDRPGDRAIIDLMLAHKPAGVEAHYNRAAYMNRRRELAQEWADMLLEGFSSPAELIDGPRKR